MLANYERLKVFALHPDAGREVAGVMPEGGASGALAIAIPVLTISEILHINHGSWTATLDGFQRRHRYSQFTEGFDLLFWCAERT